MPPTAVTARPAGRDRAILAAVQARGPHRTSAALRPSAAAGLLSRRQSVAAAARTNDVATLTVTALPRAPSCATLRRRGFPLRPSVVRGASKRCQGSQGRTGARPAPAGGTRLRGGWSPGGASIGEFPPPVGRVGRVAGCRGALAGRQHVAAPAGSLVAENKRGSLFERKEHHSHRNNGREPSPSQEALFFFTVLPKRLASNLCQICIYLLMNVFTYITIKIILKSRS